MFLSHPEAMSCAPTDISLWAEKLCSPDHAFSTVWRGKRRWVFGQQIPRVRIHTIRLSIKGVVQEGFLHA